MSMTSVSSLFCTEYAFLWISWKLSIIYILRDILFAGWNETRSKPTSLSGAGCITTLWRFRAVINGKFFNALETAGCACVQQNSVLCWSFWKRLWKRRGCCYEMEVGSTPAYYGEIIEINRNLQTLLHFLFALTFSISERK